jgi:hypothetical protein
MPDPSLNRRLDQHARRSGFAVGASMALAIALLIGGFIWLFAAINPYLSDFLGAEAAPTATPAREVVAGTGDGGNPPAAAEPTATTAVTPTVAPTQAPTQTPAPSPSEDGFQPDYQVATGGGAINFRDAPGTDGTESIEALEPGTPLDATGEEETIAGVVWLEFVDEQGRTGWIREIDVEQTDGN